MQGFNQGLRERCLETKTCQVWMCAFPGGGSIKCLTHLERGNLNRKVPTLDCPIGKVSLRGYSLDE